MTMTNQSAANQFRRNDAPYINIGTTERALSTAIGAILAAAGISRRSVPGLIVAAIGGGLIYRGVSGHCHMQAALGVDRASARPEDYFNYGIHIENSITINRTPWDLYE